MKSKIDDRDREIGRRIRIRRKLTGITQAELGAAIGLTGLQIHKLEHAVKAIDASTLIKICDIFKIPVGEILRGLSEFDGSAHAEPDTSASASVTDSKMFAPPPYKTGSRSKVWFLRGPDDVAYRVENLASWVKLNPHLFHPTDIEVSEARPVPQATRQLGLLRPGAGLRRKDWKGWIWDHDAARAEDEGS